uniref:RNA-directed RNA polymerase n=1 Tax=Penicillium brevicompactum ssRNA virus 1 TaxID=2485918 RepID=A0A3G3C4M5_9VIRU|nr:RNA-dependent RNA polymerase [Penicillium brevicompactum ssRNA virus 1]
MGSCSDSRRQMRVGMDLGVPGGWAPMVHSVCPHNELSALMMRTLAPTPPMVSDVLGADVKEMFSIFRRFVRRYDGSKWSNLQTASSYSGRLRRRYMEAWRSLEDSRSLEWYDFIIKPFLKAEKFNVTAKWPKPRMIFPRSPRYNLRLASWLKPFEHWLWGRLLGRHLFDTGEGRVVAKGLSPRRRANLIRRKFGALEDCVVVEVDGKAFEAHVGIDQLREEHSIYSAAFGGEPALMSLLGHQLRLKGTLSCGAKFSREGGRASGDFNTGMGNSIIMLCTVGAAMRRLYSGLPWDILVDGDNALLFVRGCDSHLLESLPGIVEASSGHELAVEKQVRVFEEIRFGQSAPIELGQGRGMTMVRDFRKVISNATASHRWLREPRFATRWLSGVSACELSLARGVPILQSFSVALYRRFGGISFPEFPFEDYLAMGSWFASEDDVLEVSEESRLSFERAFGVSPDVQISMERDLERRVMESPSPFGPFGVVSLPLADDGQLSPSQLPPGYPGTENISF